MTPELPVVVGVDPTPASTAALDWAAAEAERRAVPLHLVHAMPHAVTDARAREVFLAASSRVAATRPTVDVSAACPIGDPTDVLIDLSAKAGLLVVGHHGPGGFRNVRSRSVTADTARCAGCPVVVVRPGYRRMRPTAGRAGRGAENVVVGVDGAETAEAVVMFGAEEAALRGVGLLVVHVAIAGDASPPVLPRDLDALRAFAVHTVAQTGNAATVLVGRSTTAQLVVVGCPAHLGHAGLMLPRTCDTVLRHAECPVAVVH